MQANFGQSVNLLAYCAVTPGASMDSKGSCMKTEA